MEELKNKKLTAKFDGYIFLAVKVSIVLTMGVLAAVYWLGVNKIWVVNVMAIAALLCFSLVFLKEVVTGKVYANRAKKRRKRYFPFLYASKKKTSNTETNLSSPLYSQEA
jgi:hypothetical protein